MNRVSALLYAILMTITVAGGVLAEAGSPAPASLDSGAIERLSGFKGKLDASGQVFRIADPRDDLAVTVAGVRMSPPMGLTSWASFTAAGERVIVAGDVVLLEDQIHPVMQTALENDIEVTALHNHFLWDTPKVMFMHIGGAGNLQELAAGVGRIFTRIRETRGGPVQSAAKTVDPAETSLDPERVQKILGEALARVGAVYKMTVGRPTRIDGHEVAGAMGVNTWAVFAGSNEQALVEGDFAVLGPELQGVLKTLTGAGIAVTTIHNHMLGESPRIVFLHYWGTGKAADLAKAVKSALDAQSARTK